MAERIFRPLEPDLVKTNVGKWQINNNQADLQLFHSKSAYFFAMKFFNFIMEAKNYDYDSNASS